MFGPATEVENSCSLTWQGRMLVFGGYENRRQISEVQGCGLNRLQHNLPFDLYSASCTAYDSSNVMLFCFDSNNKKQCHTSSNLYDFNNTDDSFYTHEYITIAASDEKRGVLAVGSCCGGNGHAFTEMYDYRTQTWTEKANYPFAPS